MKQVKEPVDKLTGFYGKLLDGQTDCSLCFNWL